MVVYGNGFMKLPAYLRIMNFSILFYLAGTRFEGRNLYPYTRYAPRYSNNSDVISFYSSYASVE